MMCQAARRRDLTGLGDLGNIEVPLLGGAIFSQNKGAVQKNQKMDLRQ